MKRKVSASVIVLICLTTILVGGCLGLLIQCNRELPSGGGRHYWFIYEEDIENLEIVFEGNKDSFAYFSLDFCVGSEKPQDEKYYKIDYKAGTREAYYVRCNATTTQLKNNEDLGFTVYFKQNGKVIKTFSLSSKAVRAEYFATRLERLGLEP